MTTALVRAVTLFFFLSVLRAGTISGRVLQAPSGEPLSKAWLRLELDGPGQETAVSLSDSSGNFVFRDLPAGRYRLYAGKDGFRSVAYGTNGRAQAGTYLQLGASESLDEIVVRLTKMSTISGQVLDADGDPMRAQITLLRSAFVRGHKELLPGGNAGVTDARGFYTLPNLQPGKYYVLARPQAGIMRNRPVQQSDAEAMLVPTYYPDAVNETGARSIELRGGDNVEGVDIQVRPVQAGKLIPRVIPPGELPEGTTVHLEIGGDGWNRTGYPLPLKGEAPPIPLPPGKTVVTAHVDWNGKSYQDRQDLNVQPGQELQATFQPRLPLELPCAVKVEGASDKYKEFRVTLLPARRAPQVTATWKPGSECKLVNIVPGVWDIEVNPLPPELYIKSMTLNGKDVLNDEMDLQDSSTEPLVIVLSAAPAEVTAEVAKTKSGQVLPSIVLLAPPGEGLAALSRYRVLYTDGDGKARFRGISPGEYRILAFEELDEGSWGDPDFLKPFENAGALVKVAENQKATVQVQRIPADGARQ